MWERTGFNTEVFVISNSFVSLLKNILSYLKNICHFTGAIPAYPSAELLGSKMS